MQIYTVLKKGEYHLNQCEDYYYTGHLSSQIFVCAVMDGCTMGTDSYFASTLAGKLLRKAVVNIGYKEMLNKAKLFTSVEEYLKNILKGLFAELRQAKGFLQLERNELLTTLLIFVIDKKLQTGAVVVIGDGFVCIDGTLHEFDQDNKPDYIGYHLTEDFEEWYGRQTQKLMVENVTDVSIATDGIETFTRFSAAKTENPINPVQFLLTDHIKNEAEDVLERRLKQLEHNYGLLPTDDLAIVRIMP